MNMLIEKKFRNVAKTFGIMTLSTKGLFLTLSINDIQHKRHFAYQKCHYAQCLYAECHNLLIVMLNIVMVSVVMLNVVVPFKQVLKKKIKKFECSNDSQLSMLVSCIKGLLFIKLFFGKIFTFS